jgi:hypothetical protein
MSKIRCIECDVEMEPRFHPDAELDAEILSNICIDCLRDLLRLMDINLSRRAGIEGPLFENIDYSGDFPELATHLSAVTEFGYGRIVSLRGPLGLSGEEIVDLSLGEICMSYWYQWDRDYDEVVVSKEEWMAMKS